MAARVNPRSRLRDTGRERADAEHHPCEEDEGQMHLVPSQGSYRIDATNDTRGAQHAEKRQLRTDTANDSS